MMTVLSGKLQEISSREKILLLCAAAAVAWTLWYQLINEPLQEKLSRLQKQSEELTVRQDSNAVVIAQLEKSLQGNPAQAARNRLQSARSRIEELQEQMHGSGKQFVAPQRMAQALRDLLRQNQRLKLIKLDSLPVETLLEIRHNQPLVYLHGLNIQFSGDYFATLDYLKTVEEMPWRFYWQRIDYRVRNYPQAEVSVTLSTLSFQEDWLGV